MWTERDGFSVQLLIHADIVKVAQSAPKLHGCGSMQRLVQESFGSLPNQRLPADPFFPKHSEIPISPCYRHVYLTPPHHLLSCVTFSTSCLWLGCNLEGMMWWRKIKCDASMLMDQLPSLTILPTYESSIKESHNIMVCCKKTCRVWNLIIWRRVKFEMLEISVFKMFFSVLETMSFIRWDLNT